jgi:hypothetical protein
MSGTRDNALGIFIRGASATRSFTSHRLASFRVASKLYAPIAGIEAPTGETASASRRFPGEPSRERRFAARWAGANHAIDDAPLSDQRQSTLCQEQRDAMVLPRRYMGGSLIDEAGLPHHRD